MMPCHLIATWHEWNTNADDVMMTWFALFKNLVTSCLACMSCMHMHGVHALIKNGVPKYLSGLACTQANSNLGKLTTSHFWILDTQNNIPW